MVASDARDPWRILGWARLHAAIVECAAKGALPTGGTMLSDLAACARVAWPDYPALHKAVREYLARRVGQWRRIVGRRKRVYRVTSAETGMS